MIVVMAAEGNDEGLEHPVKYRTVGLLERFSSITLSSCDLLESKAGRGTGSKVQRICDLSFWR